MSAVAAQADERRRAARLGVVEWFAIAIGGLVLIAVAGLVVGLVALHRQDEARRLLSDRIEPANAASLRLTSALLDQETSVRGYVLARDDAFLAPYAAGQRAERRLVARLRRLAADPGVGVAGEVNAAAATARAWRQDFATPAIARVRAGGTPPTRGEEALGKRRFDAFRSANARLTTRLGAGRVGARADLRDAAARGRAIFVGFGGLLLLSVLMTAVLLRQAIVAPLSALARGVRDVAGGAFDRRLRAGGAREVQQLGRDVDEMRVRIVRELEALETARDELQRSNAELEQFAYVASHDLQEPLRKVASFCQMLQRRYGGQLDERGESYIEFAVDGARRMQDLINDLLAFSRVGRVAEPQVVVSCDHLVERATVALAAQIEETGARIDAGPLPEVRGEASLLGLVFQNLIANGMKFHADAPPHVRLSAHRDGPDWRFTVADNGIGIEAQYAERIFVIFQRLHARAAYEGTGIGLAMCRKIVEYHGGAIWLDTEVAAGTTFHFTLPAIEDQEHPA